MHGLFSRRYHLSSIHYVYGARFFFLQWNGFSTSTLLPISFVHSKRRNRSNHPMRTAIKQSTRISHDICRFTKYPYEIRGLYAYLPLFDLDARNRTVRISQIVLWFDLIAPSIQLFTLIVFRYQNGLDTFPFHSQSVC